MSTSPTPQLADSMAEGVLTDEKLERVRLLPPVLLEGWGSAFGGLSAFASQNALISGWRNRRKARERTYETDIFNFSCFYSQVFREIEEASERRALEEEEEAASHPGPLDPFVSALTNAELMLAARKRRRQSISISRVGSYSDVPAELQHTGSGPGSPVPWTSPPPLYRANTHTSTISSFSTATSSLASNHARHHEEENHTTQKETIARRRNTLTKAMSSALSRTLTRMRSRGAINEILPVDEALVIGVAVHEATTEETTTVDTSGHGGGSPGEEEQRKGARVGTVDGEDQTNSDSKAELGNGESPAPVTEAGPSSRRMSITFSAAVSAGTPKTEVTRSRSGSISKLRGKLPLRSQNHTAAPSTDVKQAGTGTTDDSGATSGAEEGAEKEGGKGPSVIASAKSSRRISYIAKVLAQRLRRRKSDEEGEKDKGKGSGGGEKEKETERKKGKGKSGSDQISTSGSGSQRSDKSSNSEKKKKRLSFILPAPISISEPSVAVSVVDVAARLDQPIIKSPMLDTPSISEPSSNAGSGGGGGRGAVIGTGSSVSEGIGMGALPPSPRRLPSATEIPLPPSPAGSPRSPSTSSVAAVIVQRQLDAASKERKDEETVPAMIPLPPTPASSTFPRNLSLERSTDVTSTSAPILIPNSNSESKRRRLPPSALPDSDFGPMSESTPAPTPIPSPTESAMTVPVHVSTSPFRDVTHSAFASRRESRMDLNEEGKKYEVLVDVGMDAVEAEKDAPSSEVPSDLRDEEKGIDFGVEVKVVAPAELDESEASSTSEKAIRL
ncbi:hypothetical protein A7U60_g7155 [Sanghuangporus baumii]|uniref:Uncharacterized protein n=1 Tax=Sanghuangporus baumii TaxID=108892 RepID=A0A9Q5N6H8_SANBA|nr:hypothetical protein A7U60_g7155 [Sanghuangporus baumii]